MPRVGDVVAGKYRIEEVIGEGGMGAVFAATHALTSKRVALKWMLPELAADQGAVQRFMREAQAAGRIDHPNVVDVYDVGEHEGSIFLVMEYLQGETLTAAFRRGGLDARQVIQLLLPAMRGVSAAHAMGVVHRDLKPDNIFLSRGADGSYREPKVLDFGISKVSSIGDSQQINPRLTRTGAVMGTPYYMSPEQIRGSAEVDQRTDVYAFGVILYEALTGHVPFDADAYSALILEIATGTPKRPRDLKPELPTKLEDVVLKAMAREPDQRFPTVEKLARALEPFAEGATFNVDRPDPTRSRTLGSATTPFTSEGPAQVPVQRGSLGIVVGVLLLLLGGGVWAYRRLSEPAAADNVVAPKRAAVAAPPAPVVAPEPPPAPALAAQKSPDAGVPPSVAAPTAVEPPAEAGAQPSPAPAQPAHSEGSAVGGSHHHHRPVAEPPAPAPAPAARPPRRPPGGRTGEINSSEF
jgi:serine/threonine protein kinase